MDFFLLIYRSNDFPDPYYNKWEAIIANLQGLILSKRLRGVIDRLPVLSTAGLEHDSEWRRAYSLLCFMAHSYIWGGDSPEENLPPSITVPLLHISNYLEVPPVATYAAVCLWNFKPLFADENVDNLENLATLTTFTGSIDESWFYLVSVAIEARAAPVLPSCLQQLSGSHRNIAQLVKKKDAASESEAEGSAPRTKHNFLLEMRKYMPGAHRRFLEDMTVVANIRDYVEAHTDNHELCLAYDACLAMLRTFRDKHIAIVTRYIVIKSRETRSHSRSMSPEATRSRKVDIATASRGRGDDEEKRRKLKGTGGTALIPFLKQARDETGEPTIDSWARRL
ncbi:hypothetical protein DID88_009104 [Monilinia fructigena]|uniref:Indoleamine 2,3-dioxygenase n=1 Tax=Monilinia fructigena TaxID=38457 RepID=A0A395IFU8_9HELO|nr:hypothetical protein DID88_009104 [Monilinia fructigena]